MTAKALEARLQRLVSRDPLLRSLREAARECRVELWLVGGFVRDCAVGGHAQDVDLAAGNGAPALVRHLETALGHRAFRFRKRGVTTWRMKLEDREVDVVDAGRRGLRKDLERRELTVNAIAFDLLRGSLEDPLGGLGDLNAGRLRLPRPGVMSEDPVRALRAARFLASLPESTLSRSARKEVKAAAPRVRRASVERVRDEVDRLLCARDPSRGLVALERLGLLEPILPELCALGTCSAGKGRPDVWRHTIRAVGIAARPGRLRLGDPSRAPEGARVLRWALLLHDMEKPRTLRIEGGRPTFHGHEVHGARAADRLLRRLRLPVAFRRRVSRLVLLHLRPHHLADAGPTERGLGRLVRDAGPDLPLLVIHAACDALASGAPDGAVRWRRLRPVLRALLARHEKSLVGSLPLLVDGRDVMTVLGIPPGPEVGRLLRDVRELQEEGNLADRAQALSYLETRRGKARERAP